MAKRFLNIALIFALLLPAIGVSITGTYCTMMKTMIAENCCKDQCGNNMEGCCKDVTCNYRLSIDLASVNASVEIPELTLSAIVFIPAFENYLYAIERSQRCSAYSPPHLIADIPVLVQVFRI